MSLSVRVVRGVRVWTQAVKWVIKGPVTIHADILGLMDRFSELDASLTGKLDTLIAGVNHMAGEVARLEAEVEENTSAVESAITLLNNLAAELRAAAGDPAKIAALADTLDADSNRLANAVAANTPSAPQP